MPKTKATHFSRRKSHKIVAPKARDEDDANITFEEFKTLTTMQTYTKIVTKTNSKTVYRAHDYARFMGVNLMDRTDTVEPSEYWVAQILGIRRAQTGFGAWLHVRWLWAPDEVRDRGVKNGTSHMGKWERILCQNASQSETVVHSDTIEAPTRVYSFDESIYTIPDKDAFYIRHKFNYTQKTLSSLGKGSECYCAQCDILYNPDDSCEMPLRYCATCRIWCHTGCKKVKESRFVKSNEFSNKEHHSMGLLLSGPAGDPVRPGPKSAKAHSVAARAKNIDLKPLTKRIPKDLQTRLVRLAGTRIVRPLHGNIVGNISYVLQAREWVREARIPASGLSRDRVKDLEDWFNDLTQQIDVDQLLAPDNRKEAEDTALFVCNECGYPV